MNLRDRMAELERHVVWTIRDEATFEDVLQECKLNTDRNLYREIDRDTAGQYLTRIFYADLAYSCPEMSLEEAKRLADDFLREFPEDESHYYSNGIAELRSTGGLLQLRSWNQVGQATFDWGVLVVSSRRAGCVWAEDED